MLTFDESSHTYRWDGVLVPNVTRVLSPLTSYDMVKPDVLETARQKGVAVHRMVELWAKDDLDESALPEWMRPVLVQWLRFFNDTGICIIASEKKVYHPIYKYAGTFDLRVTMRNVDGHGLIDLKRSFLAGDAIGLQLAGYQEAENVDKAQPPIRWRGALKLREDGPYRYQPFADPTDFNIFLSALSNYKTGQILKQWKEQHP